MAEDDVKYCEKVIKEKSLKKKSYQFSYYLAE